MPLFKGTPRIRQAKALWSLIGLTYLFIWSLPFWNQYGGSGVGTMEALEILRDPGQFKWYIITLFLIVVYITTDELQRGNLRAVLAATAFFLMDFFNEIWNGLFYTATGYAAVWQVGIPTAFQPLIGWNLEIIFMFFLLGIASTKLLPEDKDKMFFGWLNNRHFYAIVFSASAVIVEIILNQVGALRWNYWWWQMEFPWVLFTIGYLPFFEILYMVYDLPTIKSQAKFVGIFAGILVPCFVFFLYAGWI